MTGPSGTAGTGPRRGGAVFFDRDGVLNEDLGYVGEVARFHWLAGAREAVRHVNRSGLRAFVVTNQSGVARGLYEEAGVTAVHAHMQADLARIGAWIDAFRYCPHHPEAPRLAYRTACACRKPAPGMILDLLACHDLDPGRCLMIGDQARDVEAGLAAGIWAHRMGPSESLVAVVRAFTDQVLGVFNDRTLVGRAGAEPVSPSEAASEAAGCEDQGYASLGEPGRSW